MGYDEPPVAPSQDAYARALHILSLTSVVVCPLLIALPPRKLDLFTALLGTGTLLSANSLHRDAYGYGMLSRIAGSRSVQAPQHLAPAGSEQGEKQKHLMAYRVDTSLPTDKAREFQRNFREAEQKRRTEQGMQKSASDEYGVVDKLVYGSEDKNDWKQKRDEEVREQFAEGKGIGDVIMDQIWQVWNWDKSGTAASRGKDS